MDLGRSGRTKIYKVRTQASFREVSFFICDPGLHKQKDGLLAQLRDLGQSKTRSSRDENLVSEITRLESSLSLTRDDLVCLLSPCYFLTSDVVLASGYL